MTYLEYILKALTLIREYQINPLGHGKYLYFLGPHLLKLEDPGPTAQPYVAIGAVELPAIIWGQIHILWKMRINWPSTDGEYRYGADEYLHRFQSFNPHFLMSDKAESFSIAETNADQQFTLR